MAPTGDLPADFFEGPAPVGHDPEGEPISPDTGPLPPKRPSTAMASRDRMARRPVLPIAGAVVLGNLVLFLSGVLAGWALANRRAVAPVAEATSAIKPLLNEVARVVEDKASRSDIESLKSEVAALDRRLARLQGRLDAEPDPEPVPDLGPLQARLRDLSEASGRLSALPGELHSLDERVGALDKSVGALDERTKAFDKALDSLRAEVVTQAERLKEATTPPVKEEQTSPPASDSPGSSRGEADAADWAGTRGVDLFKKGRYAQAREVFLKQAEATPDDARLWYYAALANGCATLDWRGETERLVKRGIACERAGTPDRRRIDAAFTDLANSQVADWLKAWRERGALR
jgi:tetratricopeptide (TPR) repeat protein